jgi:hypothetical protein
MTLCKARYFFCLVAIFAGLSVTAGYPLAKKKNSSKNSTAQAQSAPPVVTVEAKTRIVPIAKGKPKAGSPDAPSDDKLHCFKADPSRDLVFDIRVKGVAKGTATVEIISLDQMQFTDKMDQSQPSGAAAVMEVEQSQAVPIKNGRANVTFHGERKGLIHLGPLPPGGSFWLPKSGPYSNVALITVSAGTKGGKQSGKIYKYVYSYRMWKNDANECSLKP